jgi:hypothetical protein
MQPLQSPSASRVFGPFLVPFELDVAPVPEAAPVPEIKRPPVEAEPPVDEEFIQLLRANLQAAAQHTALGHEGTSFRECSRPGCRDAAMLIPSLEHVEVGATDADLEVVVNRVLDELETNPPKPIAARTSLRAARSV